MQLRRLFQTLSPVVFALSIGAQCSAQIKAEDASQAATKIINDALTAMGGSAAWSSIADSTVTGSCTGSSVIGIAQATVPFTWITTKNEFRYESGVGGQGSALISDHGRPLISEPTGTVQVISQMASLLRPYHLPGTVLLQALDDSNYRVSVLDQEILGSTTTSHIEVVHWLVRAPEAGSLAEWWFDSSTNLPVKVTFQLPSQSDQAYFPVTYSFSRWGVGPNGIMIPNEIDQAIDSVGDVTCSTTGFSTNTNPTPALFDAL